MRQLNSFLTCVTLLMLLGCGGGGSQVNNDQLDAGPFVDPSTEDGTVRLLLSAEDEGGGEWYLNLSAPDADDLYQIAGTLMFDPARHEVLAVEAGGGLGDPQEAYFINTEADDGLLDFAYTSRFHGRINRGSLNLLRIRVRSTGGPAPQEFTLDQQAGRLMLRDSTRRQLSAVISGAGS